MIKENTIENTSLPAGWDLKTLGEVCDFENGDRGKNYPSKSKFVDIGIPFVNAGHIDDGILSFEKMNYISNNTFEVLSRGKFKKGDLLFCLRGSLGKFALIKDDLIGGIASSLVILKPKDSSINYYIAYYFRTKICSDFIFDLKGGAAQPNLGATDLKKFQIPLPPLPQQKQIVAILDKAFAAIDTARANAEQNLQNTKELFESYLHNIFQNKGDDWEEKSIAEVTKIVAGGTPKTGVKDYWGGDIAWITPADMGKLSKREVTLTRRTITNNGLQKSSAKLFPKNSVILSSRAPIGHLAINTIPMSTNQGCRGVVPKEDLDTIFLYYFLKGNISLLNDLGTGATFKELSTKALGSVIIPLPLLSQQKIIVKKLDNLFKETQKLEAIYIQKIADLEEMKKSVLQKAFSGQLNTIN